MATLNSQERKKRGFISTAAPFVAVQIGIQAMSVVDVAMVGRLSPDALAGVGIGNSIFLLFTMFSWGCVLGMEPLIYQASGRGDKIELRSTLVNGIVVAIIVSIPVVFLINLLPNTLIYIGVDERISSQAAYYLAGRSLNVITMNLYFACRCFLQAAHASWRIVIGIIIANVVNIVGNYILIYGGGIIPPLGVFGAGASSSLASLCSLIYLFSDPSFKDVQFSTQNIHLRLIKRIFSIGSLTGLHYVAEMGAFSITNMLAALLGIIHAAAYEVAITLASVTFTIALGCAAAASAVVGTAVGKNNVHETRLAVYRALTVSTVGTMLIAIPMFFLPSFFGSLLTSDSSVLQTAIPLIQISALFAIADNLQTVATGALRGMGETKSPFVVQLISHYLIGIPIASWLCFGLELYSVGLWWGLTIALFCAGLYLSRLSILKSSLPVRGLQFQDQSK